VGEGWESGKGRSRQGKADTLASCSKEDRRCAEGAMGEVEGRKEDGLGPLVSDMIIAASSERPDPDA